jgi:hypothetical protein
MPHITASEPMISERNLWLVTIFTDHRLPHLCLLFCWLFLISCEAEFDPFENTQSELSAFGYLEAKADTQWVRVIPGRKTLARPSSYEGHDVRLSMSNGSVVAEFQDTILTASDGYPSLSFYSTQNVDPKSTWNFTLSAPGYNDVSGQVTVPDMLEPSQMLTDAPYLYDEGDYRQVYYFDKVSEFFYAEFYYTLRRTLFEDYRTIYYPLSTDREIVVTDRGLFVTIFHSKDRNKILEHNGMDPLGPYYLDVAGVRVIFADANWVPQGGVFDPEVLIRPGIFSNLSNGLGFIGGASVNTNRWFPVEQHIVNTFGFCLPPGRVGGSASQCQAR